MSEKQADSTPAEQESAGEPKDFLEEALSHALDSVEHSDTEAGEPEPKAGDEEAQPDGEGAAEEDEPAAKGAEGEGQPEETGGDGSTAEPAPGDEVPEELKIPESLAAEEREAISKLPEEARKVVLGQIKRQQADYTRKTQELSESSRTGKEIEAVFEPYRQQLQAAGKTPTQIVNEWAKLHDFASRDPAGYVKFAAQHFGVDLRQLVNPEAGQQEGQEPGQQPMNAGLERQVGELQRYVQGMPQYVSQYLEEQRVNGEIEAFRSATDESGQPKYPRYEELKPVMAALLQSGAVTTLEDAYNSALYTHPEERDRVIGEREKAAKEAAERERQEAVEKAKRAGKNPQARRTPAQSDFSQSSLDEVIDSAMAETYDR